MSWRGIADTIAIPGVGRLVLIGFLAVLAFAAYEGTISLYLLRRFHWQPRTAAFAFAGLGLVSAVVQGGLIRRLVPRFGEARLIVAGLALASCGFAGMAIVVEGSRVGPHHAAARRRSGAAQSVGVGPDLANHPDERTGSGLWHRLLGTDNRAG